MANNNDKVAAPRPGGKLGHRVQLIGREASGALGDLGTFLPYVVAILGLGVLLPGAVFAGFGISYIATGLIYGLPIAVQPMKAVAAVILTEGLSANEIATTGVIIGFALLSLAATGALGRIARALPQSVISGLQLGLGISLALIAVGLMGDDIIVAALALATLVLFFRSPRVPIVLLMVVGGTLFSWLTVESDSATQLTRTAVAATWPTWEEFGHSFSQGVLPQLPLTVTNAVIVTAALARDMFAERSFRVTERRLALTSGALNICLTPFGALPMCHGAGGLVAHHRFGARTGLAPVFIGFVMLLLATLGGDRVIALLSLVPLALVGALLMISAVDLAANKRLFDARPSCRPVIAVAAVATVIWNPAVGLVAGLGAEAIRVILLRHPSPLRR